MEEIIKFEDWDIPGFNGVTEVQLKHPHINLCKEYFFKNFKPKAKVAVLISCSIVRPYEKSAVISSILKVCEEFPCDVLIMSKPIGIVPVKYGLLYPFKYYNWESKKETQEMKQLWPLVIKKRLEEWFNHFNNYSHIISYFSSEDKNKLFIDSKLPQTKINIFNDSFYKQAKITYPNIKTNGMLRSRMLLFPISKDRLVRNLEKVTGITSDLVFDTTRICNRGTNFLRELLIKDYYSTEELLKSTDVCRNTVQFQLKNKIPEKGYIILEKKIDGIIKFKAVKKNKELG